MTTSEEGKHEPHTFAQPVKPALIDEERKKKKREKKALTWDEHAIEEHDLLRGTRMKVSYKGKEMQDELKISFCSFYFERLINCILPLYSINSYYLFV